MKALIEQFKNRSKRKYIKARGTQKYAFVGMGMHSINNLYPLLNYFRAELKYIVTKRASNTALIDENFPYSIGTNDMEKVLNDQEVSGIFISTTPSAHYGLVKKALSAGKNVFVEKPPCLSLEELEELIEIEKQSKGTCLVGFQKQYAPCNLKLKEKVAAKCSYNYRYLTGMYPEGDPLLDLFIHPISLIHFLFGPIKHQNIMVQKQKNSKTVFLQWHHKNETIGTMELSTDYSWQIPSEELIVNTDIGIYKTTNTENLTLEAKSGAIWGIPKEKIFRGNHKLTYLVERNNFAPIITNNQLYSSGYFNEIKTFLELCASKKGENNSTLFGCRETFIVLDKIREKFDV